MSQIIMAIPFAKFSKANDHMPGQVHGSDAANLAWILL